MPKVETPEIITSLRDGRSRKRAIKRIKTVSIISANFIVVAMVIGFLWLARTEKASETPSILNFSSEIEETAATRPLDQISSAEIAYNLATLAGLEESITISNQSDSYQYLSEVSPITDSVTAKPLIVNAEIKTRKDIVTYVAVEGDTIDSLAERFSTTADSIRWSNNLSGNGVKAGEQILIPPSGLTGIVYKAASGDDAEKIAKKFAVEQERIVRFNDLDTTALNEGDVIFVPEGKIEQKVYRATNNTATYAGFAFGSSPVYGGNGYAYGYCTWYVASRRGIPRNWGNANTWDNGAIASGYTVSKAPIAGAIAQTDINSFGPGHVALVEQVSEDGAQVYISEMNGPAGWGRVGYRWVPTSTYKYIY